MTVGENRQSGHAGIARYLVVGILATLIGVYAMVGFATRHQWEDPGPRDLTTVTFASHAPDGSTPSVDVLATARKVVGDRIDGLGISGAQVDVDGTTLRVTVPSADVDQIQDIGRLGRLEIRPVVHSIPAQATSPSSSAEPSQRIADVKALRQSADQQVQILALQFHATRCGDEDPLAGNDDPSLPLVTCSSDHTEVYLLAPSIISGDDVENATSGLDDQSGQYAVEIQFNAAAATVWADFTAANVGTETAFTLDTTVITAPEIREAIPGGSTQITGDFTSDSAREFANVLNYGVLPIRLTSESSSTKTVAAGLGWTPLRIGLLAAGGILALAAIGVVAYLVRHVLRRDRSPGGKPVYVDAQGLSRPVPTNGLAVGSLICAFVFFPLGIVLGHVSLSQIKRSHEQGRGLAMAGLLISYVTAVLAVLGLIVTIVFSASSQTDNESETHFSRPSRTATSTTLASAPPSSPAPSSSASEAAPLPPFVAPAGLGANCQYPASREPSAKTAKPPRAGAVPTTPALVSASMRTNQGNIGLTLDNAKAPCTVNSFTSLARQGYFNDTPCHRLTTSEALAVLQCGDPTGSGTGGPGYEFADEYPTSQYQPGDPASKQPVVYPRGSLAMANAGPGTNGSQFFLVYEDSTLPPDYTVFGTIDETGLATIDKIAAAGVAPGGLGPEDGAPNLPVEITSIRLG